MKSANAEFCKAGAPGDTTPPRPPTTCSHCAGEPVHSRWHPAAPIPCHGWPTRRSSDSGETCVNCAKSVGIAHLGGPASKQRCFAGRGIARPPLHLLPDFFLVSYGPTCCRCCEGASWGYGPHRSLLKPRDPRNLNRYLNRLHLGIRQTGH